MTTGRNFQEILRVIDSMQLTAKHKVATPADWKQGGDVIITGAVSDEEAKLLFPGYKTLKPYVAHDVSTQIDAPPLAKRVLFHRDAARPIQRRLCADSCSVGGYPRSNREN